MWAVVCCRRQRARFLSISRLTSPFPLHYSTSSISSDTADDGVTNDKSSELMVDYLINSVGLSRDEAISASAKVSHLKSTKNPDLVINILKHFGGLDQTQLKDVVFSVPKVLLHKPEETLEPKIRAFQELGLTGSHLVKIIKYTSGDIFWRRLDTNIIPTISYLRNVMDGCDDKVVKALCRSQRLFGAKPFNVMPPNIDLLRSYGFSPEYIQRMMINCPKPLMYKPERLQDLLHKIEVEWGVARGSNAFFQAIVTLCSCRTTLESKFAVFRSFGWSDSLILFLARTRAQLFRLSESSLRLKLHFLMEELGFTPAYLASNVAYLDYSLEKRVMPRHEVLKILKGCKLVKCDLSFYSVISMTEVKFVEKFVLPYMNEVTDLYETYANSKKQHSEA